MFVLFIVFTRVKSSRSLQPRKDSKPLPDLDKTNIVYYSISVYDIINRLKGVDGDP